MSDREIFWRSIYTRVGNLAGTIRIRGGTPAERAEARAWREKHLSV